MSLSQSPPRLTVIGIDGVPHSLLSKLIDSGVMPNFEAIIKHNTMVEQNSVLPTVSSAAWTSFMTGLHPARHGISGFIIKDSNSYDVRIPDTSSIHGTVLQRVVSESGCSVFSMGVPVTSPPFSINGVMIGCFLSPNLDHAVWPPDEIPKLKNMGYSIDPDPRIAHTNRSRFMTLLQESLDARFATIQHYLQNNKWDLFLAHVMETDRLHHFYWDDYMDDTLPFHDGFIDLYQRLDRHIGRLIDTLHGCDNLIILSDHGFCRLNYEVNVARWLVENGLSSIKSEEPGLPLAHMDWSNTHVYSLIPGRLYINVRGRDPGGIVDEASKRAVLEDLKEKLLRWTAPDGERVLEGILLEEEIPGASSGCRAPDALMVPNNGMDLKDGIARSSVFERKSLTGMHTYNDALLIYPNIRRIPEDMWIGNMMPTILSHLGIPFPEDLDGYDISREI